MSNKLAKDGPQAIWDRPVFKNGTVSIPKPILDALGNPIEVRFSIEGKQIVLKKIEKTIEVNEK